MSTGVHPGRGDWQAAHARLDHHGATGAAGRQALLAERAVALARRGAVVDAAPAAVLQVVVFGLAGERWAVPCEEVVEVRRLLDVVDVPHVPPCLLGVTPLRGRVVAVLDLRRLFALPGAGLPDRSCLVVAGRDGGEVGLLGERVLGTAALHVDALASPEAALAGPRHPLLRAVSGDGIGLLDVAALLRDSRLGGDRQRQRGGARAAPGGGGP